MSTGLRLEVERLAECFLVLKAGLFTTVQDLGRSGFLAYGVPLCGGMDQFSLVAANLIVGNAPGCACLETTIVGPELEALCGMEVAVTGAECSPRINAENVSMWRTLNLKKGDVLSFGSVRGGCRAYLSVRGGVDVPVVLGSRSTFVRGGFGGMSGRALRNGDVISRLDAVPLRIEYSLSEKLLPRFSDCVEARVVLGPQEDMFTEEGVSMFLSGLFRITSDADRMGYRLDGPRVTHKKSADIVSDALLPGAVQVPQDGRPIVVMRDAQTTGGYSKVAVVISPDLNVLGQARPGGSVRFSRVSVREAQQRSREYLNLLNGLSRMLIRN
jgi:antagonist of KipI